MFRLGWYEGLTLSNGILKLYSSIFSSSSNAWTLPTCQALSTVVGMMRVRGTSGKVGLVSDLLYCLFSIWDNNCTARSEFHLADGFNNRRHRCHSGKLTIHILKGSKYLESTTFIFSEEFLSGGRGT